MNIFTATRACLLETLNSLIQEGTLPEGLVLDAITMEPPRERSHGDLATNVAMILAKPTKKSPRDVAAMLEPYIAAYPHVTEVTIAGPGFINIRVAPSAWYEVVRTIIKQEIKFGDSQIGKNERINLEFVSANPTGPMHIGHVRGAVFGDSLARVLQKVGYDVVREFYVNDAGSQIEILVRSVFLRYREASGEDIGEIPEGYYPGEYLIPVGKKIVELHGDELLAKTEEEWVAIVKPLAIEAMLNLVKSDLKSLGVEHDVFTSEKSLHDAGMINKGLKILSDKGLIYQGVLEPPKGKTAEDWEAREQTLFKASEFGDDVDRPIKKSDGSWTYFAADVAYHLDKIERGFSKMILELGADHGGYLKRITAAVRALSDDKASIDIKFHQLVNIIEDGEVVKMSKRSGNFILASDVIDAVGKDIIRFVMLTRKNDAVLDFDLAKVTEQSKDNPIFYVQYAHARACSVMRHIADEVPEAYGYLDDVGQLTNELLSHLDNEDELQLLSLLASWPRVVESAAVYLEPHRIAFYLQEVAASFHALWNKGKENTELRFIIKDNVEKTAARLALVKAVSLVVASGLDLFNVDPVEEMH